MLGGIPARLRDYVIPRSSHHKSSGAPVHSKNHSPNTPTVTSNISIDLYLRHIKPLHLRTKSSFNFTMAWFTSTEKAASTPTEPNTEGGSRLGMGAEQDRYSSHFQVPDGTADRVREGADYVRDGADRVKEGVKEGLKDFATKKGNGAEQDRYGSHFSLDNDPVAAAARWLSDKQRGVTTQDGYNGWFGLGYDGWTRARRMAMTQGAGAEQVCCRWREEGSVGTDCCRIATASISRSTLDL